MEFVLLKIKEEEEGNENTIAITIAIGINNCQVRNSFGWYLIFIELPGI